MRALRSLRSLLQLWRTLTAPGPRLGRSSVVLLEEYERLSGELAAAQSLGRRLELLSRLGPIARELHRRGVT